jgi:NADPH:quinone reductase-like Zn-dependent oxidoreductase
LLLPLKNTTIKRFMKAVICERYGPPEVLKIKEVAKPIPKPNEVLVKIIATAVNSGDVRIRGLAVEGFMRIIMRLVLGLRGPRKPVLGMVLSGVVEKVGSDVAQFKPGDEIFAATGFKCGAYAEYATVSEHGTIALKPKKASFQEAAAIPFGGGSALYFLRKAGIGQKPGQKVLVYGASGAVGTGAVQIAKHYGATVTAVCSQINTKLVKSLGADHVIAYTKEDFTKNGENYDIIFDAVGKITKKACVDSLAQDGKYITVASLDVASEQKEHLTFLSKLFDKGEYKAVIDRTYRLEDIVEAHRYVDLGKKKGNVVITVDH